MSPIKRVGIIYRKELIDILRDRRTLTAMILIPVVLYPLLMLGFVWAAQAEEEKLRAEPFLIHVDSALDAQQVTELIHRVQAIREMDDTEPGTTGPSDGSQPPADAPSKSQPNFVVEVGPPPDAAHPLGEKAQLFVNIHLMQSPPPLPPRLRVEVLYNEIHPRSRAAMEALSRVLGRLREIVARESIVELLAASRFGAPGAADLEAIFNPIEISAVSTATQRQRGGWALGQIIPIILVLMTITGGIYPAIDLTAGERERGTLETLMATPVPTLHLIVGKFLVVATVGLLTAILNLASVGATMHFGGLTQALTSAMPVEFPFSVLPIILLCMVPFALFFAAILVAVCSLARTFKEAQNYVMPVMIGALIPSMAAALPTVRLEGIMLVVPVGNMVLLTRELFQESCDWSAVAIVLLSTSLYAAAAIALAARLFGQEAVLFADAGSYRTLLQRRHFQRTHYPSASQSLFLVAMLFPVSFYAQSALGGDDIDHFFETLKKLAVWQFAGLFIVVPLAVSWYLKLDVVRSFRMRLPPLRAWFGTLLLGASSWVLAREFLMLQTRIMPLSRTLADFGQRIEAQLADQPLALVVLLLAIVPAISEELLFRGFLLSGLSTGMNRWAAILTSAAVFAVFHFWVDRMPLTFALGLLLAWTCWRSHSIWPGMLFHAMHNAWMLLLPHLPAFSRRLGVPTDSSSEHHAPIPVLISAACMFVLGLVLLGTIRASGAKRDRQG